MARLLAARGLEASTHTGRQLTAAMIEQADLVLTMSRAQRAAVVTLVPQAVRRTYTLLELAALLSAVDLPVDPDETDADRIARLPEIASAQRVRTITPRTPLDIPDPHGRSERAYRQAFTTIDTAVAAVARVVHPPAARRLEWSPPSPRAARARRRSPAPATAPTPPGAAAAAPRHGGRRSWRLR